MNKVAKTFRRFDCAGLIPFIFFVQMIPWTAFGYHNVDTTPHAAEERQLFWKETPFPWVIGPAVVGNLVGSVLLLKDYRSPDEGPSTAKKIASYSVLAIDGVPLLFAALMECPNCKSVDQVPMSDEERAAYRAPWVKSTYIFGAVQMLFSSTMYLVAEKKSVRAVAGATFFLPPIFGLIVREKFRPGPARETFVQRVQFQPLVSMDDRTFKPGVSLHYTF